MEIIKKIKQNGILFVGASLGIYSLNELIDFTEPIISALNIVGLIVMVLPLPFYLYDGIKALQKLNK